MHTASLSQIKNELKEKSHKELTDYCLRLAKFKKDNKELLNYLLFEAFDEENYKLELKEELKDEFSKINLSSIYLAKKSIRRILRMVNKHVKYSGSRQTEVELLIFFCQEMRRLHLPFQKSRVLLNLYDRQLQNIRKVMTSLNEDLQFDYQVDFQAIEKPLS